MWDGEETLSGAFWWFLLLEDVSSLNWAHVSTPPSLESSVLSSGCHNNLNNLYGTFNAKM